MVSSVSIVVYHAFDQLALMTLTWDAYQDNIGSWKASWAKGVHSFIPVPQLLVGKHGLEEAWHAVLHHDDAREPLGNWHAVIPD